MLKKKAMGIIFANMHDSAVSEMTQQRSMASLPFGGRYRMIDFYLSALVDSGISQVAVVTKSNYQSLMDHIESGRSWDLARRKGITVLPPYAYENADSNSAYHGRIAAIYGIMSYIENASAEISQRRRRFFSTRDKKFAVHNLRTGNNFARCEKNFEQVGFFKGKSSAARDKRVYLKLRRLEQDRVAQAGTRKNSQSRRCIVAKNFCVTR